MSGELNLVHKTLEQCDHHFTAFTYLLNAKKMPVFSASSWSQFAFLTMVEWEERRMVSRSDTPVEVAVRDKLGLVVKQVPRGEKMGVELKMEPHLR